jgi:hypothetical protein
MDHQHRKIAGYRELSWSDIDLMNRIKAKGAELLALQAELVAYLDNEAASKKNAWATASNADQLQGGDGDSTVEGLEFDRFARAEPFRWASIAKTDIQTGVMALVRAIAQPGI